MFSCFGFQVFLILNLEMPYSSVQKAFCVLEYAKTQSFKTVQRAFAQRFEKQDLKKYQKKSKFGHGTKSSKKKVACAE